MEAIYTILLSIAGSIIVMLLGVVGSNFLSRNKKIDEVLKSIGETLSQITTMVKVHDAEIINIKDDVKEIKEGKYLVQYHKQNR